MHKIALISLLSLPLLADFFPPVVESSITTVQANSVTSSHPFSHNGISGVIIHDYGNHIQAITSRVIQKNMDKLTIIPDEIIKHDQLPTIKTKVEVGDKVIGGYLYDNILVLAPDAKSYADIIVSADKNWIHPDLYALFLESIGENKPTKANLKAFAKAYQVGLIYIVSHGKAKLLDPISGTIISQKPLAGLPVKGKSPFYMRFSKINGGVFSSKNTQSYYQIMDRL